MEKVKIAFVAPRYHTNQVDIVSALKSHGHQVEFYVRKKSISENYIDIEPKVFDSCTFSRALTKFSNNFASSYLDFPSVWEYMRRTKNDKVDVVVVREFNRTFSLMAALVAKVRKQKVIFYTQYPCNLTQSKFKKAIKNVIMYLFKANAYSVTKKTSKYYIENEMNELNEETDTSNSSDRTVFIPFPLDKKVCRIEQVIPLKSPVRILAIGKFQRRKNIELALRAMKELRIYYDIQLTWVGELTDEGHLNEYNRVRTIVKDLDLEELVTFKVNVSTLEMPIEYINADMFILPAERENASISVVEALSYGLPVVSSTDNGTSFYLEDGKAGRVFLSNNLDSLVASISSVINHIKPDESGKPWKFYDIYRKYGSDNFYKQFSSLIQ